MVFEYLNQDLKKYMDTVPAEGIETSLVKVGRYILLFAANFSEDRHVIFTLGFDLIIIAYRLTDLDKLGNKYIKRFLSNSCAEFLGKISPKLP